MTKVFRYLRIMQPNGFGFVLSQKSNTLLSKVILGGLLGILAGLIFGEYATTLSPIGIIYIRLMEAAVYPYIISSLLIGLGRLTPNLSFKLFTYGWKSYLLLLFVAYVVLFILSDAIPYASTVTHAPFDTEKLLALLIPANLFEALSLNYVPAVILFCVLFGIAIQRVDKKERLLSIFEVISNVCLKFWQHLVLFSPIAIFSLLANTFGAINQHEFQELYLYLILFFAGTITLTFWVLPGLLSSIIPLSHGEILKQTKKAILISLSTTLSAAAIPFLQRSIERSLKKAKACHKDKKEIVDTCILVGYPFAQIGNSFIYLFIFFSAFYYNHAISDKNPFLVALISYLSSIGTSTSTINSLGFISEWLSLPATTTNFYVSLMPIIRYGLATTSVMGLSFFTYITAFAYFDLIRIQWGKLCMHLVSGFLVLILLSKATSPFFPAPGKRFVERLNTFEIHETTQATLIKYPHPLPKALQNQDALDRILATHILRIGYNAHQKPFSYFNRSGHLVGFDISYAYDLAKSLHASIEFVPYNWNSVIDKLNNGQFDLALGGIYVTSDRLNQVHFSSPYLKCQASIITTKDKERRFNSTVSINHSDLKIAYFKDSLFESLSHHYFTKQNLIELKTFEDNFIHELEQKQIDGILWNEIQANIWANASSKYVSSTPLDLDAKLLFAFMLSKHSPKLLEYVNYWLKIKDEEGFFAENKAHWINGAPSRTFKRAHLMTTIRKRLHLNS